MSKRFLFAHPSADTVWPCPEVLGSHDSVTWKLHYAQESLTQEEANFAASILHAYRALTLHCNAKERAAVVKAIRQAMRTEPAKEAK